MKEASIFIARYPLCLASGSPRRVAFLRELGLEVSVVYPPGDAEPMSMPGEDPAAFAMRASEAKAVASLPRIRETLSFERPPVLVAADTVVVSDEGILGKPDSPAHAFAMLSSLAGKTHTVITGCLVWPLSGDAAKTANCSASPDSPAHRQPVSFAVRSLVRMWNCPSSLLWAYANSGEPMDKAGAYGVQGAGAFLVREIQGSWSNVVGLPLAELVQTLLRMDVIAPALQNSTDMAQAFPA